MKILKIVAISIATLALPVAVFAQTPGRGLEPRKDDIPVNPEKKKAEEKLYSDSLSNITTKEYDPWAYVREKPPAEKPPVAKKKPPVRPFVQ